MCAALSRIDVINDDVAAMLRNHCDKMALKIEKSGCWATSGAWFRKELLTLTELRKHVYNFSDLFWFDRIEVGGL